MSEQISTPVKGKGFAIWSIIFGVMSFLGCWLVVPAVFAVLGIIFSIISSARGLKKDINVAGMVISIIGLVLCLICLGIYMLLVKNLPPFIGWLSDIIG